MKNVRLLSVQIAFALLFVRLLSVQECRADTRTDIAVAMAMANAVPAGPVASPAALPPIDFDLSAMNVAPAVAAPAAFQRAIIERRESHTCPRCGAIVLAKSGRGPEPGTHIHVCPYCNVAWFHGDK